MLRGEGAGEEGLAGRNDLRGTKEGRREEREGKEKKEQGF